MIWLPIVGNYVEIDAYASILAYTTLLNQRHQPAKSYIPFAPNYSVPSALRLPELENSTLDLKLTDQVVILDVSVPEAIHKNVSDDQILELIDHHPGYEAYWTQRLGDRAIIEPIGAVATVVYERWGECWNYEKMSPSIAKLLLAAILDNTLNFNADITTTRDCNAATHLATIAQVNLTDFTNWYFSAVSQTIIHNPESSLINDCKTVRNFHFAQLTLWDSTSILQTPTLLSNIMNAHYQTWLISIIDISTRQNYFLTNSTTTILPLIKLLNLKPRNAFYRSSRIYLRKEIIAKLP